MSDRIPLHNFYARLKGILDLNFLYPTIKYYSGESGPKNSDSTVFFKLCLIGYLENIISEGALIQNNSLHLDVSYFLGYGIDEELP